MKAAAGGALLGLLPACAPEKGTGQPAGRFAPAGAAVEIDGEGALLVVGGATSTAADGPLREAWSFAPADGRWRRRADPPAPTARGVAVQIDGLVYVFGGSTTGWTEHAWLWAYDPAADAWTELDLGAGPSPRAKPAAAAVDGRLIVVGGRDDDSGEELADAEVWAFDPAAGAWERLALPGGPAALHRHAAAAGPDGALWVHGGFQPDPADPDAPLDRADRLWRVDLDGGGWTEQPAGAGPRASHALVPAGDGLLAWGGRSGDTAAWAFDPEAGGWSPAPARPAPASRDGFASDLAPGGGALWLAAGDPSSERLPDFVMDVWALDLADLTWQRLD